MASSISPDLLLPPLLAHLAGSTKCFEPPPSIYPLLSPILRQRLTLLSACPNGPSDSWPALLSWSQEDGGHLVSKLNSLELLPHPSSGELEVGEVVAPAFRRFDAETLKCHIRLQDWDIHLYYMWVEKDTDGEDETWKLLEVRASPDGTEDDWQPSIYGAEESFCLPSSLFGRNRAKNDTTCRAVHGNDDDYWNLYDNASPFQPPDLKQHETNRATEGTYFESYSEVEPALDGPLLCSDKLGGKTSMGSTQSHTTSSPPAALDSRQFTVADARSIKQTHTDIEAQSETAIRQHISTSMKSLYRLSRSTGNTHKEFESIIQTELALLTLMEDEGI